MDLLEAIIVYRKLSKIRPCCISETNKYFIFPDKSLARGCFDIYRFPLIVVDKQHKTCCRKNSAEIMEEMDDCLVKWYHEDEIYSIWHTVLENQFFETGELVVKFRGASTYRLTNGKLYKVLSIENGWYKIIDDKGCDSNGSKILEHLYPSKVFEIVES